MRGIRGERIVLKAEFMKGLKDEEDLARSDHDLWGIPERLGNVTGKLKPVMSKCTVSINMCSGGTRIYRGRRTIISH